MRWFESPNRRNRERGFKHKSPPQSRHHLARGANGAGL